MSVLLDPPGRPGFSLSEPRRTSVPAGAIIMVAGLGLLIWQARFRLAEANASAWAVSAVRLRPASAFGTNVVFPLAGRWVGYSVAVGCTAALLVAPFFAIAGVLLIFGRVDQRRALLALGVTTVIIFLVNQLRLLVIAGSMVLWGFQTGYERSHILLGTVLSTIGVIAGIIVFVWMLIGTPNRSRSGVLSGK